MKYKEVQELKDQEEQAEDKQVELWIGDQELVDQAEARDKGESVEEEEEEVKEENMEEKSIQMELHLKVN
jgi:hypothetical protein